MERIKQDIEFATFCIDTITFYPIDLTVGRILDNLETIRNVCKRIENTTQHIETSVICQKINQIIDNWLVDKSLSDYHDLIYDLKDLGKLLKERQS